MAAVGRSPDGAPLFMLLPGALGGSHALDAASREALPESVIRRAAELLDVPLAFSKGIRSQAVGSAKDNFRMVRSISLLRSSFRELGVRS